MTELTSKQVTESIETLGGIKRPNEMLPFVGGQRNPYRTKVMAAIAADDGHALSTYCARAVSEALREADFKTPIDSRAMRAIAAAPNGWELIHDVIAGRENAAAHLAKRIENFRSALGDRSERRRDTANEAGGHRREQATAPHQDRNQSRQANSVHDSPPPRRNDGANVTQIGSARRSNRTESPENSSEISYDSVKVHGGKAALTIEASRSKRDVPTINIEAAKMKDPAARTYDWSNKIILQLTVSELHHAMCLFLGWIDEVKGNNHGHDNDKFFQIERQHGSYAGTIKFALGKGKDQLCIVQLTPSDMGNVVALFLRVCAQQLKIDQMAVATALRPIAQAHKDQMNARESRSQRNVGRAS